jgi:polyhydroxyalkanoate synthesis repressor PhaR
MPVIKRYANRKLYDTDAKGYITLEGVAALIRQGRDVRVIDHESGADITLQVLAQIIFEEEKKAAGGLPGTVLTGLIQAGSDTLSHLRHAILPDGHELRAEMDAEIDRRLAALARAGVLSASEARRWQAVLALGRTLADDSAWPSEVELKAALLRRGVPSRAQLLKLAQQIERLAAEIDDLASRK